ncbi:hypothetical protein LTR85_008804 [Meristemomyces frigidus]|nr:hypothetical protein LTR85_008804 [Meristemomyces frigidus]
MAPPSPTGAAVHEGVFAINKPPGITSAQVIRDVQTHFHSSQLFKPWFERERAKKDAESHNQRKKRNTWKSRQSLQNVKIGHGGTLDPLATGVLILGVGNGTKSLNKFLECTKSYETVLLFGAATDSYDTEGKIVARKPYAHVTRELVEQKLADFRGKIMQRPPIFSAKRIQGKRLYEYAREGIPLPEGYTIEECALEVQELEMTEWMEGGTHGFHWPEEEAAKGEKEVAAKVLHLEDGEASGGAERGEGSESGAADGSPSTKRKRDDETVTGPAETTSAPSPKRAKTSPEPEPVDASTSKDTPTANQPETSASSNPPSPATQPNPVSKNNKPPCPAPAVRLRMTVTSGFYVRSLCHDLGAAVGSLGIMAALVRTRQAEFELGVNTLWYEDLAQGEGVWGPKVEEMLERWNGRERVAAKKEGKVAGDEGEGEQEAGEGRRGEDGSAKPAVRARVRRNTSSEEE